MSDIIYETDEQDHRGWRSDPFEGQRIDVPLGDVTDAPRNCVEISLDWVPVIISALERLKFGDMWNGGATEVARAASNISTLQTMLAVGECEGGNMDYTCYDMPLHSPIIDWLPADPFENDPPIPHGYVYPPWQVITVAEPLEGYRVGDVVVNTLALLTSFPPIIPTSGVPRMQITVQGPAEVDIEFARVFQGGIALVFVDGLPVYWVNLQLFNVADILNVNSWLELFGFAVDSFTRGPLEMPIELPDDQEYVVEIQMFPRPALDYTIGIGGGIRGISICSEKEQVDMSPFVTDIRINEGTVEKEVDSVWSAVTQEDTDDVLTESDLRGNGCSLEYYDLATSLWVKVAGSDYLNVLNTCVIQDKLEISTDTLPQLRIRHATSNLSGSWTQHSSGLSQFIGYNGFSISTFLTGTRYDQTLNNMYLAKRPGINVTNAFLNIMSNAAEAILALNARDASVTDFLRTFDENNREMAVIGSNGWISAIQQLIINDFTSTGAKRGQGRLLGQWADDTDATRKGRTIVQVDDFNGIREGLRVESNGVDPMLGFYGDAAVSKQTVIGGTAKAALEGLLVAFDNLGLIDDQTDIITGGEGIVPEKYFEIVEDYSIDRGTDLPHNFTVPNLWGDFVNEQGFVSEPDAGTPEHMRLRCNMAVDDFEEILRIRLTYLVADGAAGDFNHDMVHPASGTIIALPNGQDTAEGPETLVFDMYPVGFRWTSGQVIRFSYSDLDAESEHIVTLQKIEVMGVGRPLFRHYATSNDVDIYEETIPEWST